MKVVVTAQGNNLDSAVDQRFGRCAWFVVFDTEAGTHEAVSNEQNLQAAQGAGVQSATTVADTGCTAVLTGHCGPKAFRALSAAGIEVLVGASGTVREALEAYRAGSLKAASAADVEGHW